MKKLKLLGFLLVALLVVQASLVIASAQDKIKIGVLQTVDHPALNDVFTGFQEALNNSDLKDRIEWNFENAAGDKSALQSMAEKLARDNDILFAIATPAAQALATVETEKPIFIAAVTAPVEAGLAESIEKPGRNVTGTSNLSPIVEQVDFLLRNFPETKTIGLIYNSSEVNSVVNTDRAKEVFDEKGIAVEEGTVTSTNDVASVMTALVKKVDVVFLVTDNTIDSSIGIVGDIAKEAGVPVVGSADSTIKANGLATLSNSYVDFGVQTAEMVIRMIEEELNPAEMPIEYANNLQVTVNEDFAKALGIDPASIK